MLHLRQDRFEGQKKTNVRYQRVHLQSIGYELAPNVVTSASIEKRLAPVYEKLGMPYGQIEMLTGVRERRYWDENDSMSLGQHAAVAGHRALEASGLRPGDVGMLLYGGVCRENLEPATACTVADALGIGGDAIVHDLCNACLGVMNGMFQIANAIELGQIRAGMVVSCESARQIVDLTIARMLNQPDLDTVKDAIATMTGGSGAIAVILTDGSFESGGRRVTGGVIRSAPEHHRLSRWGPDSGIPSSAPQIMVTDAAATMQEGVKLGVETYRAFLNEIGWPQTGPDRVICHQVGAPHRVSVLESIGIELERDFSTFEYLGNIGTVSLPLTAAIADERGFLQRGQRVGFFGIGSGLNCLMLGIEW